MKLARWMSVLMLLLLAAQWAAAQRRDPLTDKEADQMRDAADDPNKRIHLMVTFVKARMEAVEHMRSDQNMANVQADKISSLLDDVASIVDEIDDNLSDYDSRGDDVRKGLREVIEMDTDLQLKIRAMKESTAPAKKNAFDFTLDNALDSVNSSADSARSMLEDQNAKKGKEKIDKNEKKERDAKVKPPKQKKQRPDYTGMGGIGQQPPR